MSDRPDPSGDLFDRVEDQPRRASDAEITACVDAATHDEDDRRIAAVEALGALAGSGGDRAETVLDPLLAATDDEDPTIVAKAVWGLGNLANERPDLARERDLIGVFLEHSESAVDDEVRFRAVRQLRDVANGDPSVLAGTDAIDRLVSALERDEGGDLPVTAASTFLLLAHDAPELLLENDVVDHLVDATTHEDRLVRVDAATALAALVAEDLVDDRVETVVHNAIEDLSGIDADHVERTLEGGYGAR